MLKVACVCYQGEEPQLQHILGRKLILYMLKENGIADLTEEELEEKLTFSTFGKPDCHHSLGVHMNISNCRGAVVAALCDDPVGIDIEGMRKVKHAIVKRVLSAAEFEREKDMLNKVQGISDPSMVGSGDFAADKVRDDSFLEDESCRRFLTYWTLKEAYLKMTGEGFSMDPRLLTFDIPEDQGRIRLCRGVFPELPYQAIEDAWLWQIPLGEDYILALSVDRKTAPSFEGLTVEYVDSATLL